MNQQGTFLASLLDASTRAFAAGVVERQRAALGERLAADQGSFQGALGEAETRVRTLAEALAVGSSALFEGHVAWLRDTYLARGVSLDILTSELEALRAELCESLPSGAETVEAVLARADAVARETPEAAPTPLEEGGPHADLARAFLVHALEGRREDALELVTSAADRGVPIAELQDDLLLRVQRETGVMWQRGELQVAEEHLCSGVVAEALTLLRIRIPRAPDGARRAIISAIDGNAHDMGARMVADRFALAGWSALFFGASLPAGDAVWASETFRADLIVLSATLPLHVRPMARLIERIRGNSQVDVPILVGGGPFDSDPELWRAVGASGGSSSAADAVATAERLCGAE